MTANGRVPAGAAPLDLLDAEILRELRAAWAELDPVPDTLVDRVRLAVELDGLDADVLLMTEVEALAGARGDEHSRMITFESETFAITVQLRDNEDATVRLDGWLSPPGGHRVELHGETGFAAADADVGGRFLFERVPRGPARFVVRPAGRTGVVSTPKLEL